MNTPELYMQNLGFTDLNADKKVPLKISNNMRELERLLISRKIIDGNDDQFLTLLCDNLCESLKTICRQITEKTECYAKCKSLLKHFRSIDSSSVGFDFSKANWISFQERIASHIKYYDTMFVGVFQHFISGIEKVAGCNLRWIELEPLLQSKREEALTERNRDPEEDDPSFWKLKFSSSQPIRNTSGTSNSLPSHPVGSLHEIPSHPVGSLHGIPSQPVLLRRKVHHNRSIMPLQHSELLHK